MKRCGPANQGKGHGLHSFNEVPIFDERPNPANAPAIHELKAVQFPCTFADRCHHGKEENLLFKTMVDRGFPREAGAIAVMLLERNSSASRRKRRVPACTRPC